MTSSIWGTKRSKEEGKGHFPRGNNNMIYMIFTAVPSGSYDQRLLSAGTHMDCGGGSFVFGAMPQTHLTYVAFICECSRLLRGVWKQWGLTWPVKPPFPKMFGYQGLCYFADMLRNHRSIRTVVRAVSGMGRERGCSPVRKHAFIGKSGILLVLNRITKRWFTLDMC